ncbi:hypothetical protein 6991_0041 [Klebsiella phage 6991]|nr:hypothetical protein PRB86_gp53 [Klebsiella phage vB_Kpn_ZCKp20p]YP_010686092.1 hypothetical protein PRB93_gp41 [Klebsiella phage 6991]URY99575.1 hypothetical protein 6991_0041 [Klebsiella phage 6991]UXQ88433.1 hypothetical protein [Klebsiella phage vB_Kpn_ZCKp20p]
MKMNEFKGTPGPWRVNTIGKHWNNPALVHLEVTFGTDGECICDTVYRRKDADLIAAAPELLDALKCLLVRVADDEEYGPEHAITIAREAIKKALGESQ